ncbi:MAG: SurA N-terminal domain-containing protein [Pseudomonadota bacterium]
MMEAIRKGASSWIVKLLVIVPLILAFAVWGIEDMLRGGTYGALATVGDRKIEGEQFQNSYNEQINLIARQGGRRLTPQEAVRFGIPNQILSRMMGTLAVEEHAEDLGLALSDDAVAREIFSDPNFQDSNGNFDRARLNGLLAQAQLSEAAFVQQRKQAELRDQITGSMLAGVVPSKTLLDLTNQFQNATRKVRFITVPAPKLETIAAPTDEEVKSYFEERKASFKTQEYRKATVLQITAADVSKAMKVSDEDLQKQYDATKAQYVTPERRTIEQIVFPSEEAAQKAKDEIDGGKDFMDVAKASGANENDVKLGVRAQSDLIDSTIADAAFALEKDKVSDPVKGNFTTVLLRVTDIAAGETKPLSDAKDQVREQIVQQRLPEEIQRLHDLVDERKLAGKTTDEIAKELGLKTIPIAAIDRQGRDPDGKRVLDGADGTRTVGQIFEGIVGVESAVIERTDGGYTWVDVLDITPPRDQTLEEVKGDIATALKQQKADADLRKTADEFAERIKKGETLDAIAATSEELSVVETDAFKRTDTPAGLPGPAVARAFTLANGGVAVSAAAGNQGRIVLQVSEVAAAPKLTDETREQLRSALQQQQRTDIVAQYIADLQAAYGTSIDQNQLVRLLGLDQTQ